MEHGQFIAALKTIVGNRHVLTEPHKTQSYRKGYRFGSGSALAVVRPGTLLEQWKIVQTCVAADKIVIMQAANTGLTGGSTPDGPGYDRDIVIISTLRMNKMQVINEGKQIICFPGATLDQLEQTLRPMGREPHSVIGSSCIGASVIGGVCNNSGGSLVQRGPAYTELALYAQVKDDGQVYLVNHLGIALGNAPEDILQQLENQNYTESNIDYTSGNASDQRYGDYVRDVGADTPARFNADPQRLYEASGCAGKLILFAVRLDTFPMAKETAVFYIGTNDPNELTRMRQEILAGFKTLPVAGEYMHRDAYDIAERYGKDTFLAINIMGTKRIPLFFRWKSTVDALCERIGWLPRNISDYVLQGLSQLFPSHLPKRIRQYRNTYDHYLMLKMAGPGIAEARNFLKSFFELSKTGNYFECSGDEGRKAFLHRFAAAGAAVRYRAVHQQHIEGIVALDIALKRNDQTWIETLPADLDQKIAAKMYYGHFFCYVFHQDYLIKKGYNPLAIEHEMWALLDDRGAEYPAEHNVGHLYLAKPVLKEFYQSLDPQNCFNPGIGQTSKQKNWR